jgi:hypothetical protein
MVYDCPQPTPMLLTMNVHYSRISDIVVPDHLVTNPSIPIRAYRDGFGNWCNRIVAPAGRTRLSANGIVNDTGEPDVVASQAQQHAVEDLPDEAFVFLLGSRYCETDRLTEIAWSLVRENPARLEPGPSHLRLRSPAHCLRLRTRARLQDSLGSLLRSHRRLPGLYSPRRRLLPLHEHPGAILHRLSGRYRRPGLGRADGFRSLVRSLSRRRVVHFRCAQECSAHRPRADRPVGAMRRTSQSPRHSVRTLSAVSG